MSKPPVSSKITQLPILTALARFLCQESDQLLDQVERLALSGTRLDSFQIESLDSKGVTSMESFDVVPKSLLDEDISKILNPSFFT